MSSLTTVATDLIYSMGLTGVSIGLIVNCMGIPIPSEIVIPLTGIGVHEGHFDLFLAFFATLVAQMVGLYLSYAIGRFGGLELVQRYGKYVFFSRHELVRAQTAFEKYGGRLVFVGLILPGVHGYVGYPAGIAKMPVWRFGIAAAAGASIWSVALIALGYFLGDYLNQIDAAFHNFALVVVVLLAIAGIWYLSTHKKRESR